MYYLWTGLMLVLTILTIGYALYLLFAYWQGNAEFRLETIRKKEAAENYTATDTGIRSIKLQTRRTLRNVGREQGTLMDCFGRAYLPHEYVAGARVHVLVMDVARPRTDNYWEALIVPAKRSVELQIEVTLEATEGRIADLVARMPDMDIDVIYQVVSRTDWTYDKSRLVVPGEAWRRAYLMEGGRQ